MPHRHTLSASRHSLTALALDERTIAQRKMAIAMYGFSWIKPAGCAKTMLGRREEEVEREEMERQLREAEVEQQYQMEGEEAERAEDLQQQREVEGAGGVITGGQGDQDLDDMIPDAEDEPPEDEDEMMEGDLDNEVPDADPSPYIYDTRREPDTESEEDIEGATGITDEVEASHLNSSTSNRPTRTLGGPQRNTRLRTSTQRGNTSRTRASQWSEVDDEEALANAMLDEDELGEVERNLDDDIPEAGDVAERDLDDEVPDPDDEGEWQHTDTELEMEESAMDISGVQTRSQARRMSGNAAAGQRRVQLVTPGAQQAPAAATSSGQRASSGGGRMSWLDSSNARRNLFSRVASGGPGSADVFGPSSAATRNITPRTQLMRDSISGQAQTPQNVRRGARRLGATRAVGQRRGTENEDTMERDIG